MTDAPDSVRTPRPRVSLAAVLSLVLGLLGLMFAFALGLLAAVPGIVLGHVALSSIRRSGGVRTGRPYALLGLVCGYLVVGFNAVAVVANMSGSREPANREACLNNLRQVSTAILMYRAEHDGEYPARLADLYPEYLTPDAVSAPENASVSLLLCPSAGRRPAGDPATMDRWTDYDYFPVAADINDPGAALDEALRYFPGRGTAPADTPAARTVVLRDKKPVHAPGGRNKAFADGHVEFVEEPGS